MIEEICNRDLLEDDADLLVNPVSCDEYNDYEITKRFISKFNDSTDLFLNTYIASLQSGQLKSGRCCLYITSFSKNRYVVFFPLILKKVEEDEFISMEEIKKRLYELREIIGYLNIRSIALPSLNVDISIIKDILDSPNEPYTIRIYS